MVYNGNSHFECWLLGTSHGKVGGGGGGGGGGFSL